MPRKQRPKTTRRPAGRPPASARVVTPEVQEQIGQWWLEGRTYLAIAKALGVAESTIRHHVEEHLRPMWRADLSDRLAEEVAKVEHLEAVAWERFHASCEPTTTEDLKYQLTHAKGKKPCERLVERAVKSVTTSGSPAWLQIVCWCRDWFGRVGGWYQPEERGGSDREPVLPAVIIEVKTRDQAKMAMDFHDWEAHVKAKYGPEFDEWRRQHGR